MDRTDGAFLLVLLMVLALMGAFFWKASQKRAEFAATCEEAGGKMIRAQDIRVCIHRDVVIEVAD